MLIDMFMYIHVQLHVHFKYSIHLKICIDLLYVQLCTKLYSESLSNSLVEQIITVNDSMTHSYSKEKSLVPIGINIVQIAWVIIQWLIRILVQFLNESRVVEWLDWVMSQSSLMYGWNLQIEALKKKKTPLIHRLYFKHANTDKPSDTKSEKSQCCWTVIDTFGSPFQWPEITVT